MPIETIINTEGKFEIELILSDDGFCYCPVCGEKATNKDWRPYDKMGYPSYDICSCGFEFGFDCGPDGPHTKSWAVYRLKLSGDLDHGNSKLLSMLDKIKQLENIKITV